MHYSSGVNGDGSQNREDYPEENGAIDMPDGEVIVDS